MALVTSATCLTLTLGVTLLLTLAPCNAAMIFPEDDYGVNFMAKRQIHPDCLRCLTSFDSSYSGSCLRCWGARSGAVVPFHSKRSFASDEDESYDGGLLAPQPFRRVARVSGCACCRFTRIQDSFCCTLCAEEVKRVGLPSDAPRPS